MNWTQMSAHCRHTGAEYSGTVWTGEPPSAVREGTNTRRRPPGRITTHRDTEDTEFSFFPLCDLSGSVVEMCWLQPPPRNAIMTLSTGRGQAGRYPI